MMLAAFRAFVERTENADKRFELLNGEMIDMPAPSPLHAYIAGIIYAAVLRFLETHDLGFAFPDSVRYELNDATEILPDASYIAYTRQSTLPARFTIAPNLAVAVVAPSNRPRQMLNKVELYLASGTEVVGVVYPDERIVDVYRAGEGDAVVLNKLEADDHIDGGDVLPGFTLNVSEIFPQA